MCSSFPQTRRPRLWPIERAKAISACWKTSRKSRPWISRRSKKGRTELPSPASEAVAQRAKLLIGGQWVAGSETFPVTDKFSGAVIGEADRASRDQVAAAVAAARRSFETVRL